MHSITLNHFSTSFPDTIAPFDSRWKIVVRQVMVLAALIYWQPRHFISFASIMWITATMLISRGTSTSSFLS